MLKFVIVLWSFRLEDSEPIYEDIDQLGYLLEETCGRDGEQAAADRLVTQPLCNAISKVTTNQHQR